MADQGGLGVFCDECSAPATCYDESDGLYCCDRCCSHGGGTLCEPLDALESRITPKDETSEPFGEVVLPFDDATFDNCVIVDVDVDEDRVQVLCQNQWTAEGGRLEPANARKLAEALTRAADAIERSG